MNTKQILVCKMENQTQDRIDSIAVCVVTNNNDEEAMVFIDHLLKNTSGNYTLYIYDYQSRNKTFLNYLANVCMSNAGSFKFITEETKLAAIYNMFIENVCERFIAFVTINTMLDYDWTTALLYHHKNVANSGCISIRSQHDNVQLSSALFYNISKDEDEMRAIWTKQLNVLDAPVFFENSIVLSSSSSKSPIYCAHCTQPNK